MRKIIFSSEQHRDFYNTYVPQCRYQDVYHKALIYTIGIDEDTRKNFRRIYDIKTGCICTECLEDGWITSGSARIVRMAFNLYCNGVPSVDDQKRKEDKIDECRRYTVEDIFCCSYARYFWEAIKIRYPEYCPGEEQ